MNPLHQMHLNLAGGILAALRGLAGSVPNGAAINFPVAQLQQQHDAMQAEIQKQMGEAQAQQQAAQEQAAQEHPPEQPPQQVMPPSE